MKKNSTSVSTVKERNKTQDETLRPRRSTIEAIRQFARAYTYEPQLRGELSNLVAN